MVDKFHPRDERAMVPKASFLLSPKDAEWARSDAKTKKMESSTEYTLKQGLSGSKSISNAPCEDSATSAKNRPTSNLSPTNPEDGETHLAPTNRHLPAAAMARELRETGSTILGGDFNDTPGSETLRLLGDSFVGFEGEPTIPADVPRSAIDFVAVSRGLRIANRELLDKRLASDHRPTRSVVELGSP